MAITTLAAAFEQAFAFEAAGREQEALDLYRRILAAVPQHPGALLKLAESDLRHGDTRNARQRLQAALRSAASMHLPSADIQTALGRLERAKGRDAEASAAFEAALAESPSHPGAVLELGVMAHRAGDFALAEERFTALTQRNPELGIGWLQLSLVLEQRGRLGEAREAAAKALRARNTIAAAWEHAARLAWRTRDYEAAQALCKEGLARYPAFPAIMHQQGIVLKLMGLPGRACDVLAKALELAPEDAGLRLSLGAACLDAGRAADAAAHLEHAISRGVSSGEAWDNLGLARRTLGDLQGALQAFERAVALAPNLTPAVANLLQAKQQACAWDGLDELERALAANLEKPSADPRLPPWISLTTSLDAAQQLAVARRWARAMLPAPIARWRPTSRPARLRIGYLSNDFREHPAGRLMAGVFELHDRSRFEIFAYSYGRDDRSALRQRIRGAVDVWRDLQDLSDADAARRIRDDRIDVLVDRKGLTRGARLAILAYRPAPVQLHYQGYPGTLGYDALDGFVADGDVIPPQDEVHFHERVLRLGRCFFANDSRRGVPAAGTRAEHGLPEGALVLACFNQAYKITRPFFEVWMEALAAAPQAVLWLLDISRLQQRNLRGEMRRAGVDPQRLSFAPFLPQEAHMARVACADLSLDTLPVGQHTTACDALWAGVPLLTCRGATFAGRVGTSLLHAVELPELITDSLEAYRQRLLELVRAPQVLQRYREHLEHGRSRLPLFDTAGFVRDWEALLVRAYEEIGAGAS